MASSNSSAFGSSFRQAGGNEDVSVAQLVRALLGNTRAIAKKHTTEHSELQALHVATASMAALGSQIAKATSFMSPLIRTQIATGAHLGSVFENTGLSLSEDLQVLSEGLKIGLANTNAALMGSTEAATKQIRESTSLMRVFKLLGGDSQALATFLKSNTDMLGVSLEGANSLAQTMLDVGQSRHVDFDALRSAIQQLSKMLVKTSAVYGATTSRAIQEASIMLTGALPGASEQITSLMTSLFGGSAESVITAMRLGISPGRLQGSSAEDVLSVVIDAISRASDITAGLGQGGQAALRFENMAQSYGFNEGFIAVSNQLAAQGETLKSLLSIKESALLSAALDKDLQTSLEGFKKGLLMPLLGISNVLKRIGADSTKFYIGMGIAMTSVIMLLTALKVINAYQALTGGGPLTKLIAILGGAALILPIALAGFAATNLGISDDQKKRDEERNKLLENSRRKTYRHQADLNATMKLLYNAVQAQTNDNANHATAANNTGQKIIVAVNNTGTTGTVKKFVTDPDPKNTTN